MTRGGKIVLHRGYGLANREKKIPNGQDTIFAIGSIPIDFTKAAILKLEAEGKLRTSDSIAKYLPNVPDDERAITIDQLMHDTSGLPNFHGFPGVDKDLDLSWIDRKTAIDRILGRELLFTPGNGESHSPSAWGLPAAMVEIVSGKSYGQYLRAEFFEPAGMSRTGLHEEGARFADEDVLLTADGSPLTDPGMLLRLLRTGGSITFEVERAGARKTITVTPTHRAEPPSPSLRGLRRVAAGCRRWSQVFRRSISG